MLNEKEHIKLLIVALEKLQAAGKLSSEGLKHLKELRELEKEL